MCSIDRNPKTQVRGKFKRTMTLAEAALAKHKKSVRALLGAKWSVGFKDRGLGHGDFAVLTKIGELVVECPNKEIANHIVRLHNSDLSEKIHCKKRRLTFSSGK